MPNQKQFLDDKPIAMLIRPMIDECIALLSMVKPQQCSSTRRNDSLSAIAKQSALFFLYDGSEQRRPLEPCFKSDTPSRRRTPMRKSSVPLIASVFLFQFVLPRSSGHAQAAPAQAAYPAMAPLAQYLTPDERSEIALARSAAPASISNDAEVMVLRHDGYATVAKGKNGFLCLVERSWGKPTGDPEFWNPRMRAPHCFNAAAATTFAPIYLMKTRLVLAGKSQKEIAAATASALDRKELPALEPGAMAYMMSKQQYLGDGDSSWHSHTMFYFSGDAAKSWAADLPDSPVMAANDPEERVTILFVLADQWSDGTAATSMMH
jgi:hypothetical protein